MKQLPHVESLVDQGIIVGQRAIGHKHREAVHHAPDLNHQPAGPDCCASQCPAQNSVMMAGLLAGCPCLASILNGPVRFASLVLSAAREGLVQPVFVERAMARIPIGIGQHEPEFGIPP